MPQEHATGTLHQLHGIVVEPRAWREQGLVPWCRIQMSFSRTFPKRLCGCHKNTRLAHYTSCMALSSSHVHGVSRGLSRGAEFKCHFGALSRNDCADATRTRDWHTTPAAWHCRRATCMA